MKNHFVLLLLAFLILILACGMASALKETRITTNTAEQWNPSIWNNYITWTDARNGGSDIYLQNMANKQQTRVTKGVDAQNPCVAGTKIVWDDGRNGNRDIYMYDISTKKTTRITSDKADQTKPATYDKYIVWLDNGKGYSDVCLYDMTTKKIIRLSSETYVENVAIYDSKIVWSNYYSGSMYDIKTKKTVGVAGAYPVVVDIYGTKVYYYDWWDQSDVRLYVYDFAKNKTTELNWYSVEDVYSTKYVYADTRNGNSDIYMAQI